MNSKKFFEEAKKAGLEASELSISKNTNLSFSLFHGEIDNYSISSESKVKAKGIYKGQMGLVVSEKDNNSEIPVLIESLKKSASILEKKENPIIFKGSEKYHKKNLFNANLPTISVDEKLKKLHELEDAAYKADKRVTEVQVSYDESDSESILSNSYGLKLKNKSNYYDYVVQVVVKDGEEVKSNFAIKLESDFTKFDPVELANKAVNDAISLLHGTPCKSKSYKVVLNQNVTASLLSVAINASCNADSVQRNSSVFVGKLNTEVFSKKITIEERPLDKNCFFTYFDDEGVATYNKKIINKGVLQTYLYNLEAANKDKVQSTGNGFGQRIGTVNLTLKPGKLSEEELISRVKNGVYISNISGLHAGLNAQSGNFSLEAEGYHIVDGKKSGPLTLITVGGNIYQLFKDIIAVGNNSETQLSSTTAPSIAVKGLKVSAS